MAVSGRKIYHKEDINVRTETDKKTCSIFGCAVLSSDKLILTDHYNQKLKVVDISKKAVVNEKTLDSNPFDVTVLPEDQIAVTMQYKGEILIMRTSGQLATSRSIKLQGECRGITYHQGNLYVVCVRPSSVVIVDTEGNVKDTLLLKDGHGFRNSWYIELSQDSQLLYISGGSQSDVVGSITLQGEIFAKYNDLEGPYGLLMLDDGSLLVCNAGKNSIYRLQGDLNKSQELATGLMMPVSICCRPAHREVYVGCLSLDQLKVFSIQ